MSSDLFTGDSALLGGGEKINVPLAGPVSFNGFMLLGPAVLIGLRVYLQIYVEHGDRLDRLARLLSVPRAPSLVPLQNPLIRLFSALIFYLLLLVTMPLLAWKADVFPDRALVRSSPDSQHRVEVQHAATKCLHALEIDVG